MADAAETVAIGSATLAPDCVMCHDQRAGPVASGVQLMPADGSNGAGPVGSLVVWQGGGQHALLCSRASRLGSWLRVAAAGIGRRDLSDAADPGSRRPDPDRHPGVLVRCPRDSP